jgi:hypothetical protein
VHRRHERWGVDLTWYCAGGDHCGVGDSTAGCENHVYRIGYTVNGQTYYDDNGGAGYTVYF